MEPHCLHTGAGALEREPDASILDKPHPLFGPNVLICREGLTSKNMGPAGESVKSPAETRGPELTPPHDTQAATQGCPRRCSTGTYTCNVSCLDPQMAFHQNPDKWARKPFTCAHLLILNSSARYTHPNLHVNTPHTHRKPRGTWEIATLSQMGKLRLKEVAATCTQEECPCRGAIPELTAATPVPSLRFGLARRTEPIYLPASEPTAALVHSLTNSSS